MIKKPLSFLGMGLLALSLLTTGAFPVSADQEVVKIGPVAGQRCRQAEYGNDFKRSVTMVFDRANRMGGIHGKQVELVILDSRGDPKESVLIAEKLVADPDVIAEIGDFSSSSCMAAAPIYEKAGMTQLSPTSSHMGFTKRVDTCFGWSPPRATKVPTMPDGQ